MQAEKPKVPTIQGVTKQWQQFNDNYMEFDSCPQTLFFTLANMLQLDKAKNILEVACGAGKLIPMILDLKNPQTNYFATDLSSKMIQLAQNRLKTHFNKYESKLSYEEWINKQKLFFGTANGQEKLAPQLPQFQSQTLQKFDRIICNLVLMLTPDAQKMLKNLRQHASEGCLLGLSIWGNQSLNNFHVLTSQIIQQLNLQKSPPSRSNFHLYKKMQELALKTGWQVVLDWQQNSIIPHLNSQDARPYAKFVARKMMQYPQQIRAKIQNRMVEKIDQILSSKKALNFPTQCLILRKKSQCQ